MSTNYTLINGIRIPSHTPTPVEAGDEIRLGKLILTVGQGILGTSVRVSTPVRQQYLRLKALHPDALLFFRLGDFYELFDADAEIASRELQLTLTGREFSRGQRSPMAGVPHHHADTYIGRLIERGYRVAIADQIGDPKAAKGLVERRVVRVITPGTVRDPALLDSSRNNYLTAVLVHEGAAGLAYCDITTGEFVLQQVTAEPIARALLRELARVAPAECLWPLHAIQPALVEPSLDPIPTALQPDDPVPPFTVPGCVMTPFAPTHFALDAAVTALAGHLGIHSLDGLPYATYTLALGAAGALLAYLQHTQPASLPILRQPILYRAGDHMTLDAPTRRNLELVQTMRGGVPTGSLLAVLDRTRTPMGGRLLRRWLNAPLVVLPPLLRRQAGRGRAGPGYRYAPPPARCPRRHRRHRPSGLPCTAGQCHPTRAAGAGPRPRSPAGRPDCPRTGRIPPQPSRLPLPVTRWTPAPPLSTPAASLPAASALPWSKSRPPRIADGGFVRSGYSPAVDAVDAGSREAREWLAGLEAAERARTGIRSLKVVYNRVFGYALEVGKSGLEQVPDDYVRKQTVATGERYITPELKQREAQLLQAQEQRLRLEVEILEELRRRVAEHAGRLLRSADALGQIDVYAAYAVVALEHDYVAAPTRRRRHDRR